MKTRTFLSLIWLTIFVMPLLNAQNVTEKTLCKSFNLQGKQKLRIEMSNVEIRTWNEPTARIEMTIACENVSEAMLKSLITAGRYNVVNNTENDVMIFTAPAMQKTVRLNGQELKDNIKYILNVPKDVNIDNIGSVTKVNTKLNPTIQ